MRSTLPKTILVIAIITAAIMWLVGAVMDGVLSETVTMVSAGTFILLFLSAVLAGLVGTRKREAAVDDFTARRKKRMADFASAGFFATKKFIGSDRILSVDENRGEWYLIDYFYEPEKAELHRISDVLSVETALAKGYIPRSRTILLPNGKKMDAKTRADYFNKSGVVIALRGEEQPVEFVNCYKTDRDADIIVSYFDSLIKRQGGGGTL